MCGITNILLELRFAYSGLSRIDLIHGSILPKLLKALYYLSIEDKEQIICKCHCLVDVKVVQAAVPSLVGPSPKMTLTKRDPSYL